MMLIQAIFSIIAFNTVNGDLVAFTVGQATHLDLVNHVTVPFQTVVTNHNILLNNGVFNCPAAGIYKFQVYSLTKNSTALYLDIYHNSVPVATLWGRSHVDYAAAGNVVILQLNQGDTVRVKARGSHVTTFGKVGQIYTTFTGVQLREQDNGSTVLAPYKGPLNNDSLLTTTVATVFRTTAFPLAAFSAVVTDHQSVQSGSRVIYDTVRVDTAQAYNKYNGIYTAPSSGFYALYFFSLASKDNELWQELFHNDKYVCSLYGKTPNEYDDAGNSVILHLEAGDHIHVKAHPNRPNHIYGQPDQMYTTLSAYTLVTDADVDNTLEPGVFFSAGLTHKRTFQNGEWIVFDRVFTDHGTYNHYDHLTGEFTAPKPGTYEFNFHALAQKSQPIWLELYHNYKYIVSLYGHDPSGYAAAGNAAVIDMYDGDVVYIRAHGTNALYGLSDQVYCTFSGALLQSTSGGLHIVG